MHTSAYAPLPLSCIPCNFVPDTHLTGAAPSVYGSSAAPYLVLYRSVSRMRLSLRCYSKLSAAKNRLRSLSRSLRRVPCS